jgi:hypothetical protein
VLPVTQPGRKHPLWQGRAPGCIMATAAEQWKQEAIVPCSIPCYNYIDVLGVSFTMKRREALLQT